MINWDIWNQGLQNRFNEIGAGQYDWSKITPDVVKGFTRYQALRPEQDVKKANKYKEILENIKDEDLNTIFGDELDEEVKQAVDWESPDEKDSDEKWKEWRKTAAEQRNRKAMFNPSVPDAKSSPLLPESEDAGVVLGQPTEEPYESTYDRDALIEKHMRKTLGSDYDDYKRAYETYGSLNPYEQMIQAGKRSSYWDPEIGKIYTDAGEKIRQNNIDIWKDLQNSRMNLLRLAQQRFEKTGRPSDLKTVRALENELKTLALNDPRAGGYIMDSLLGDYGVALPEYGKRFGQIRDVSGNITDEDKFWSALGRGDVYKTVADLRNDPFYKNSTDEDKTMYEQEWRKRRNEFAKNKQERKTAVEGQLKSADKKEMDAQEELINKLSAIDFSKADKFTGMQILDALKTAGYDPEQVMEADPIFRQIRSAVGGTKSKTWQQLLQEAPDMAGLVVEGFAKSVFPMLRSKNLWEGNSGDLQRIANALKDETSKRYDAVRERAREYVDGWEETYLDPAYDGWYKKDRWGTSFNTEETPTDNKDGQVDANNGNTQTGDKTGSGSKKVKAKDIKLSQVAGKVAPSTAEATSKKLSKGDYKVVGEVEKNGEKYTQVEVEGGSFITTLEIPSEDFATDSLEQVFITGQRPKTAEVPTKHEVPVKKKVPADTDYEAD